MPDERVPDETPAPDSSDGTSSQGPADEGTGSATGTPRSQRSFLKELPVLLVVALLLSFLIQTFLARVYVIPSESMEPTLLGCNGCGITNDRIVVDKVSYRFTDPRPGDVVVFKGPDSWSSEFTTTRSGNVVVRGLQQVGSLVGLAPPDERDFVKRVIATGGQTVECCDAQGRVQVDGKPLDEPYVVNDFPFVAGEVDCTSSVTSGRCFDAVTVPAGHLWMMGDNRDNSSDSRFHVGDDARGTVPVDNVIGKARVVVVPVSRWQVIHAPEINPTSAALGLPGVGALPGALALGLAVPGLSGSVTGRSGRRRR